ncbi:hypothetical protein TWF718_002393 [Orbilia javanica]|uniref:Uncharacterized protein n=1 Tax=Orbilia javanica TaxID=47235 RepID=A0AAN8MMD9_9PEZI
MVSRKRRRAGLKARETYLRRLASTPRPGFGQRLWTTGHPGDHHKALWKKVNAEINHPKPRSRPFVREPVKARNEGARLRLETFKDLHNIAEKKNLQELKAITPKERNVAKAQENQEAEAFRGTDSGQTKPDEVKPKIDPDETESEADSQDTTIKTDPDETESEIDPDETESEVDPDKTESEVDPDGTESEIDPDETESEVDPDETESEGG